MSYYIIHNNQIYIAENEQALSKYYTEEVQELPDDYIVDKYIIVDGKLVLNPDYEQEQAEKERERIGELQITKRVFALGLQQMGITYSQLKTLIATNEQAQMEWDLCVELQRKNPLLDIMAAQLGVSSEMLDYIFRKANGEDVDLPTSEEI